MLSAYSALNFGHRHPELVRAATEQLERVTLTSRAFHNDRFGPFCKDLAELCGMEMVLPMNTGAEAVETALKTARRWGYDVKGVPQDRAKIVVCAGNFHGRTITIISFSSDPDAKGGFGPFTPGFVEVPYGDADGARRGARRPDVVGFLVEPIQGEAGVVVPPDGYLRAARELCTQHRVLHDRRRDPVGPRSHRHHVRVRARGRPARPLHPGQGAGRRHHAAVSAVVSTRDVLGVFRPGEHGSTFGGNPLACAVGIEVIRLLRTGKYQERATRLGARLIERLRAEAPRRRARDPRQGPVGRHRPRPRRRDGARRVRTADGTRRAGQGHPRDDRAPRAAAGRLRRGPRRSDRHHPRHPRRARLSPHALGCPRPIDEGGTDVSDNSGGFAPPPPPPSAGGGGPIPQRGIGQILSTAFEVYKANAAKLITIVAIVVVPLALIDALLTKVVWAPKKATVETVLGNHTVYLPRNFFVALSASLLGAALAFVMSFVVQAAVSRAAAQATVGDVVDTESSYRWGFRHFGSVLLISLLAGLAIFVGLILLRHPGAHRDRDAVRRDPGAGVRGQARHRTRSAGPGSWSRAASGTSRGTILLAGLIAGIVAGILTALAGSNWFVYWILSAIGRVITVPFTALVSVLLYLDLRAKREALTGDTVRAEIASDA